MMLPFSGKRRGSVMEVMVTPLFHIGVAVMVAILLIGAINNFASSDSFQRRFVAIDLGLFLDALAVVRDDVSMAVEFRIPEGLAGEVSPREVKVVGRDPKSPSVFWFSESKESQYVYGNVEGNAVFFKEPGKMGVGVLDVGKAKVLCSERPKGLKLELARVEGLGDSAAVVAEGDLVVAARARVGQKKVVRAYALPRDVPAACVVVEQVAEVLGGLDGVAIVPVSPEFIFLSDERSVVFADERGGVFVDAQVPVGDVSKVLRGVYEGVRVLG